MLQIGLCAHARAHRIADHPADAGICPAVRLQCRGMVMGLDLENHVVLLVEADHAGVVRKHAHAPIVHAQLFPDFLRGGENCFLEHVLEMPLDLVVVIMNLSGKSFVAAMFAPGLGDGFQFYVGRIATRAS